jgi:ABC-type phosphate/phosphonate transport system permease subunit
MSLSHHQQRQLHRIESGLLGADPQLAEMLGIFGKLSAGQAMPSWEQVPTRRDRVRQAAALTVQAVTLAAAAVGLLLSAILALLLVAAGARHRHRRPAPGPERTRRGRGTGGRPDPAGQS